MLHVLGWIFALGLMAVGIAGTVIPGIPGTLIVFAGLFLGAWIDHFNHVGAMLLVVLGLLSFLAYLLETLAIGVAVKTVNASREAFIGALLGTIAGLFTDFVGVLIMPFIGAAIGEFLAQHKIARAAHVGAVTWLGLIFGMAARLALAFTMIGIFVVAFVWKH
jgi:uncharacterized protein YqgC (DUF456 family)